MLAVIDKVPPFWPDGRRGYGLALRAGAAEAVTQGSIVTYGWGHRPCAHSASRWFLNLLLAPLSCLHPSRCEKREIRITWEARPGHATHEEAQLRDRMEPCFGHT